ncbi:hypothetical protein Scep_012935 [Stephania cephalantha]|uniref:Uncharacterized protein n=1 Tax=Stephania cephalantha TaxID=152367 RepID=A0AAP0JGG7_9MAGN
MCGMNISSIFRMHPSGATSSSGGTKNIALFWKNDRVTGEEARTSDDMVAEADEMVASGSDSSGIGDVPIQ